MQHEHGQIKGRRSPEKNARSKARGLARKAANVAKNEAIQKAYQAKNGGLSRKQSQAATALKKDNNVV